MSEVLNVEKLFGENVFTLGKMQERLPKKAFAEVKRVMEHGGELDNATADVVAKTMKDWAVEHGATHYTHCNEDGGRNRKSGDSGAFAGCPL